MSKKRPKRNLYHCGIIPDGPADSVHIAGSTTTHPEFPDDPRKNSYGRSAEFPRVTRKFRDDSDKEGTVLYGQVLALSDKDRDAILEGIKRRVVVWAGMTDPEDHGKGIGPGGNYWSARIWDKETAGFYDNVDEQSSAIEPLARYVYFYPVVSRDQHYQGVPPTVEECEKGLDSDLLIAKREQIKRTLEAIDQQLGGSEADVLEKEAKKKAEREARRQEKHSKSRGRN